MTVMITVTPTDDEKPAATSPGLDDLRVLAEIRRAAEARIDELAPRVHNEELRTWADIDRALGIKPDAARKRYSPKGRAGAIANAEATKARQATMRRSHEILKQVLEGGRFSVA